MKIKNSFLLQSSTNTLKVRLNTSFRDLKLTYLDGIISNINDFAKLMRNLGQNYNGQELSNKFGGVYLKDFTIDEAKPL